MSAFKNQIGATMSGKQAETELGESLALRESALTTNMPGELSPEEDRAILRRIDLRLMPLLTISYMLQFIDKQTLNFSSIMGIMTDLDLKGTDYTWCASAFYFGYLAFTSFGSFLMVRLPIGKYLATSSIIWALILGCHAATQSFTGLFIARFFLGAAEASISPGFSLITGMWYKRQEQPFRHGIWFFGNSVAVMFGSLLGYAIAHIRGSLAAWRWGFIIFGLVTLAWAIVLLIFLPDTPMKARFLSPEQKVKAVNRVRSNHTGIKDNHFKWQHVREALLDIKIWLLVIYQLSFSIPNGAFTAFSSIILNGFGFTIFQVYLLSIPMGVVHAIFSLGCTLLCSRFKNIRTVVAASICLVSLGGSMLVRYGPNQGSKLVGLYLFIIYVAGFPISLSMVSSNVAGFSKKSVASGMMFMAYTGGNIIGPFLFFPDQAPTYSSGFLGTGICFGIATVAMVTLRFVIIFENKRRDKVQGEAPAQHYEDRSINDLTDKENLNFRYLY
ncbi:hypothetical protein RBB50_008440 [Rhinocladiella similis]